jgi:dienelactone hydrolase
MPDHSMMAYVDWLFGILSAPMGWIGAAIAALGTVGLAVLLWRTASVGRGRTVAVMLVGGLGASAALVAPYLLAVSRSRSPLGAFKVQVANIVLPPLDSDRFAAPMRLQIWFPYKGASVSKVTAQSCADLLSLPLASAGNPKRLVLYMPHYKGQGDDNKGRLSYLASYGYIVAAFDDIARGDIPSDAKNEGEARRFTFQASTQADYEHALSLFDIRVKRQAEKSLSGLDRLADCAATNAASPWSNAVDYAHVGFLGFSFGGSTAAEAATMDVRIAAVVNLEGNLYDRAFAGHVAVPYLYVMSGRSIPTMKSMMSNDPEKRYLERLDARSMRETARLAARKGSTGIRVNGSLHTSFSDAVLDPHASRFWLFRNPIAFYNAVNRYTLDFFDVHLRGEPPALIDRPSSNIPVVQTFRDIGMTPDEGMALPPRQDAAGAPIK